MAHPLKVLIVEDEELYRLKLDAFILELGYEVIATTDNSEEAIKIIINSEPDIVIMDININGKLNGIEIANKLQQTNTSFLFITSLKDKELYQQARQTSCIGYLIKPFNELTLQSAIEYAIRIQKDKTISQKDFKEWTSDLVIKDRILIKHNCQLYKVLISDIIYIEAKGKLSLLHTKQKNLISNTSLTKLLNALPLNAFIRVHKSFVVNTKYINKIILKNNAIFIGETPLPIGRAYKDAFLNRFDVF